MRPTYTWHDTLQTIGTLEGGVYRLRTRFPFHRSLAQSAPVRFFLAGFNVRTFIELLSLPTKSRTSYRSNGDSSSLEIYKSAHITRPLAETWSSRRSQRIDPRSSHSEISLTRFIDPHVGSSTHPASFGRSATLPFRKTSLRLGLGTFALESPARSEP